MIPYKIGERTNCFCLIEQGRLRAGDGLRQSEPFYFETVVPGTTSGEFPFFSKTARRVTVMVERDCIVWLMEQDGWERLPKEELGVSRELSRVSLKLTGERMSAITSYILAMAV
jgi:SulP family sulfate permease